MKFKRKILTLFLGIFAIYGLAIASNEVKANTESVQITVSDDGYVYTSFNDLVNYFGELPEDFEGSGIIIGENFNHNFTIKGQYNKDSFGELIFSGYLISIPGLTDDYGMDLAFSTNNSLYPALLDDGVYQLTLLSSDNIEPVISGETTFVTDVDDAKAISYFMQFLSAYDETDGDVSDSLTVIQDNYTANKRVLGNHTFTVQASDTSGNTIDAVINIRVVDITKPIITGSNTIAQIGYKETFNIESFRSTLVASDNHTNLTNADIIIKTDGYTANKTKLGTYNIVFSVVDDSGNEGTFTKQVKVIDNIAPVFSGPETIATSNNTVLTESEIRAQLTAHDDIDGVLTGQIVLVEDNYSGYGNKVGTYTIRYSVTDNAGNTANHTVTIQRSDNIPPTIWVQNGTLIRTTAAIPLDYDTIIDILEATGQINVTAMTTFSFPLDEYTGNETEPGIYSMVVKSQSTTGSESIHSLSILVMETDEEAPVTREPGEWLKDNMVTIGIIAVIGLGLIYYIKKRK